MTAIGQIDTAQLNTRAGNPEETLVTRNIPDDPAPVLSRKSCGSCAMLGDDNLCAIHAIAGEAAKPRACQDFPWRFVETPGGVYAGLSFVCPSVRANRGRALEEQTDAISAHYLRAASVREAPAAVMLNSRRALAWSDDLALEHGLVDILNMPGKALPVRIIACCLLPGFIDQVLTESERPDQVKTGLGEIITALSKRGYDHIFRLAEKRVKTNQSPRPRRMFLGMFTSFANTLHRRENQGRVAMVAGVMKQYLRSAAGMGRIRLAPIDVALSHEKLDAAHLPAGGPVADHISRYIRHCIERKDLVLAGDVNRRMRLLAVNAALIGWYATALQASATKSKTPQSPDNASSFENWDEAIGIIERLYGFHSTFYQFFERNKTFSDVVDSFILKPGFPHMLLS